MSNHDPPPHHCGKLPSSNFDRARLDRLKQAYARALAEDRDYFPFDGMELLTSYAKYLIEFLEMQIANSK